MQQVLVPFDGSDNALRAVRYAASAARDQPGLQLELLHVVDPMSLRSNAVYTQDQLRGLQAEEAERLLQPARRLLEQEGIPFRAGWRAGSAAGEIASRVREGGFDGVIMGTRGMSPVANVVIGSVATRVVHLVDVPVILIK